MKLRFLQSYGWHQGKFRRIAVLQEDNIQKQLNRIVTPWKILLQFGKETEKSRLFSFI